VPFDFRSIAWGRGRAHDSLYREAESTERAHKVTDNFVGKYSRTGEADWEADGCSVEIKIPCQTQENFCSAFGPTGQNIRTIYEAENLMRVASMHDPAVFGYVRSGFDPETGEEMVWDDDPREFN
jgi:hypothetical protein